jgi:hypothetical protein
MYISDSSYGLKDYIIQWQAVIQINKDAEVFTGV